MMRAIMSGSLWPNIIFAMAYRNILNHSLAHIYIQQITNEYIHKKKKTVVYNRLIYNLKPEE